MTVHERERLISREIHCGDGPVIINVGIDPITVRVETTNDRHVRSRFFQSRVLPESELLSVTSLRTLVAC